MFLSLLLLDVSLVWRTYVVAITSGVGASIVLLELHIVKTMRNCALPLTMARKRRQHLLT